jgi:outer membrane protein OmpA-like peptidoglycan-associated protein/Tol biopolymer transport system component
MSRSLFSLIAFAFVVSPVLTQAQSISSLLKDARRCAENFELGCAEEKYKQVIAQEPNHQEANRELGMLMAYYMLKKDQAAPFLEKGLTGVSSEDSTLEALNALAMSYHFIGEYEKAKKVYAIVSAKAAKNATGNEIRTQAGHAIASCDFALEYNIPVKNVVVTNLGDKVNTPGSEYAPVFLKQDSTLIFTARRKENTGGVVDIWDGKYYEDIYIANQDHQKYSNTHSVQSSDDHFQIIRNTPYHESIVSESPDGKTILLFLENKLFQSRLENGNWTEPEDLGSNVNFGEYHNHGVISPDGKYLYFSARAKNTKTGMDIYRSKMQSDRTWGPAERLDDRVNTEWDEQSPTISPDGKTLYFSSNGLIGYGGYDLFAIELNGDLIGKLKHFEMPLNSAGDDLFMNISADGSVGLFASNRKGGFGEMDLYRINFPVKRPLNQCPMSNLVTINVTPEVTPGQLVRVEGVMTNASLSANSWRWSVAGAQNKVEISKWDTTFSKPGNYVIVGEATYITAEGVPVAVCAQTNVSVKDSAVLANNNNNTNNTNNNNTSNANGPIDLKTVYFDYDKSGIRADAAEAMRYNLELLKKNPNAKIVLSGHTDARGNDEYNNALSQRRVNAIRQYLIANGISKSRIITAEGKGESQPANKCTDDVECSEPDHQLNRRVEMKVVQ